MPTTRFLVQRLFGKAVVVAGWVLAVQGFVTIFLLVKSRAVGWRVRGLMPSRLLSSSPKVLGARGQVANNKGGPFVANNFKSRAYAAGFCSISCAVTAFMCKLYHIRLYKLKSVTILSVVTRFTFYIVNQIMRRKHIKLIFKLLLVALALAALVERLQIGTLTDLRFLLVLLLKLWLGRKPTVSDEVMPAMYGQYERPHQGMGRKLVRPTVTFGLHQIQPRTKPGAIKRY